MGQHFVVARTFRSALEDSLQGISESAAGCEVEREERLAAQRLEREENLEALAERDGDDAEAPPEVLHPRRERGQSRGIA